MRMESAGTTEPAGLTSRPTPVRSNIVAAGTGRTPAPLNIVGEETLVKVSSEDSDGTLAFFHLVAPPMSGPPRHVGGEPGRESRASMTARQPLRP